MVVLVGGRGVLMSEEPLYMYGRQRENSCLRGIKSPHSGLQRDFLNNPLREFNRNLRLATPLGHRAFLTDKVTENRWLIHPNSLCSPLGGGRKAVSERRSRRAQTVGVRGRGLCSISENTRVYYGLKPTWHARGPRQGARAAPGRSNHPRQRCRPCRSMIRT